MRFVATDVFRAGQGRSGGDGGIRTLDRALQPYNGLANRRLQPLGHISNMADMPDAGATRKRQIRVFGTSANYYLNTKELRLAAPRRVGIVRQGAVSPGETQPSGGTWIGSGECPARERSTIVT